MAREGFRVFDSDMHAYEPPDLFDERLESGYDGPVPRYVGDRSNLRWFSWDIDGRIVGPRLDPDRPYGVVTGSNDPVYAPYIEARFDGASQVEAMDVEGVDIAAIFPTSGAGIKDDPALAPRHAATLSRVVNDWLGDFCAVAPARMRPAAVLPLQDVELACEEAERAIMKHHAMCIVLPSRSVLSRRYYDPVYKPLWDLLEQHDIAATFHASGGRSELDVSSRYRHQHQTMHKIVTHTTEMSLVLMEMILGGVLERHPRLRVGFLESFCGWVPWWLWRLDEGAETYVQEKGFPPLARKPSEYFTEQCSVAAEIDEPHVRDFIDRLSPDNLVVSTDYPHHDSPFPHAIETFLAAEDLSRDEKQKILWDNCARLYGVTDS